MEAILSKAQMRELDKRIKSYLAMKKKVAKLQDDFKNDAETFKALCIGMSIDSYESKAGKFTVATPETTEWDCESVKAKLTGEEVAEYFPATAKKGALTERVNSDPAFASRVAGCFVKGKGTPTLTVKPV